MKTNENKITKEQLYVKYCLMAKKQMDEESLTKKQKKLSGWLLVIWFSLVSITLFIYFSISGFDTNGFINWQAFYELTGDGLGYWTVTGAFVLGLIFVFIVETRKPNPIQINQIFEKAEILIKEEEEKYKREKKRNLPEV